MPGASALSCARRDLYQVHLLSFCNPCFVPAFVLVSSLEDTATTQRCPLARCAKRAAALRHAPPHTHTPQNIFYSAALAAVKAADTALGGAKIHLFCTPPPPPAPATTSSPSPRHPSPAPVFPPPPPLARPTACLLGCTRRGHSCVPHGSAVRARGTQRRRHGIALSCRRCAQAPQRRLCPQPVMDVEETLRLCVCRGRTHVRHTGRQRAVDWQR